MTGPIISESRLRVRYAETDRMGVAYHAHYLVWCEVGRTDFIRALGASYADLERAGLLLAVASAEVRYGGAAEYDDAILVRTRLERVQSRALTFAYEITNDDDGRRLALARSRLVSLDPQRTPRSLPTELLETFRDAQSPPLSF